MKTQSFLFKTNQPRGYVTLITVIVVGAIAATIAIFLLLTGTGSSQASFGVASGVGARQAASACADLALGTIQANTALTTPANGNQTLDAAAKQTCTYTINGTSPNYTIVAVGQVDASGANYTRRITITLNQVVPQLQVASWQETP